MLPSVGTIGATAHNLEEYKQPYNSKLPQQHWSNTSCKTTSKRQTRVTSELLNYVQKRTNNSRKMNKEYINYCRTDSSTYTTTDSMDYDCWGGSGSYDR